MKAQFLVKENVTYRLYDKDGNLKPMFEENRLFKYLMKQGILSPTAKKIPGLLGSWKLEVNRSNLITNAGRAALSGLVNGSGAPAAFTFVAVGTGVVAANVTDTTLGTETATSGLSRAAGTVSIVTTTITNDTAQIAKTFSVSGPVTVTEAGLLNASSVGTLLARQVFSAVNVVNGDSLAITWQIKNA